MTVTALTTAVPALAATFNLSLGDYPECSTNWNLSGSTYTCDGNGRITLDDGDDIIADSPSALVANNGFDLGNGSIGSSINPINLTSAYGDITADGTTIFGNLEASSGDIDLTDADLTGSITTNAKVDLVDSTVTGDVFGQNGIETQNSDIDGTLSANSDINLEGGSVAGQVTSFSNEIEAENTNLLSGAEAQSGMSFEGGTLSGDFVMTANNPITFENVTLLAGSVSGASTVSIENSTFGSPSSPVNVSSTSGEIDLYNSTVYGNLTAPNYSEIDVSNNSEVYGTCTPANPDCQAAQPEPPGNCALNTGLQGEFFDNQNLSGSPAYEDTVSNIDNSWGSSSPNTAAVGNDDFSIRWTGYLYAPTTGTYTLATNSDDGVRLYVDGDLIVEDWSDHAARVRTGTVFLQAGDLVPIVLEYYENGGRATIQLLWERPGQPGRGIIPASAFYNCTSLTPVAYYPLNESSYSGAAGEILDYSGNNNHATTTGNITPAAGYTCEGASVPANNSSALRSAIDTGLNPGNATPTRGTLSFWYKSNVDWDDGSGNQQRVLFSANTDNLGGNNKYFYLVLRGNGRLRFEFEDSNDADFSLQANNSTSNFNANEWVHIAATWNLNADVVALYANGTSIGTFNVNTTGLLSQLNTLYIGDNRSNYAEPGRSANGVFDEVRLYDYAQSSSQILADMNNTVACSTTGTCITDTFDGTLSNDWQTLRSSGNFTPQVVAGRLRLTPDTNNIATATTLLRQFPSENNRVVVEFDFYAYKNNGSTNAADGVTVTFSDRNITPFPGSFGGSLGYAQRTYTNPANNDPGFNGGWLGIGLDEFGNFSNPTEGRIGGPGLRSNAIAIRGYGSGTSGYRYLRGTAANISPSVLTSSTTPHRYRISIDNSNGTQALVKIERNAGSGYVTLVNEFDALNEAGQPAIPEKLVLTLTGSTGGSSANHEIDNLQVCADIIEPYDAPIHHFELVRNQTVGLTCEPLDVTIRACANQACTLEYTAPFTATLSPADGWAGGNQATDIVSGESISFLPDAAGTYTLGIPNSTPSTVPLTQNLCFVGGSTTAETNCEVTFSDVGLRFFPSDNSTSATAFFDLIAGATEGPFSVQAVRTNTTTGVCEGLFSDGGTLDFAAGTQCSDPASCSPSQQVSLTNAGTTTVLPNPQNEIAGEDTTTLPLTFSSTSTASFSLQSPDVGVQPLAMEYTLQDVDGDPSPITLTQTVNLRVQPAELRLLRVQNSAGDLLATDGSITASANAPIFTRASEPFQLDVQAVNALGDATPNFARTAALPTINWGVLSNRVAPSAAAAQGTINGGVGSSTPGSAWEIYVQPDGTPDTSTLSLAPGLGLHYSDLGVIDLQGRIEDYLTRPGSPDMTVDSDTVRVGRFIPAYLRVTQDNPATWGAVSYRYQGQAAVLSSIPLRVDAFDINDDPVSNYDGDFFKLALTTGDLYRKPASLDSTGDALVYNPVTWALSDNNDYNDGVTLTLSQTSLTWPRAAAGPTIDDTPQMLNQLIIEAVKLDDGEACHGDLTQCEDLVLELGAITLYYARLNAERQVSAQELAELPVWVERLDSVDSSVTPNNVSFVPFTSDSETGNSEIPGLTFQGVCEPGVLNCATVANSADGTLIGLNAGAGTLEAESATPGIVGVLVDVPGWLEWNWDAGLGSTGPLSTLYFGLYQGRSPLLFQLDGFR